MQRLRLVAPDLVRRALQAVHFGLEKQRVVAEGEVTRKRPREIPTQPSETGAAEHDEDAEADECIEEAGKQDEAAEEPSGCAKRVRARTSGFNVGTEGEELVAFAWLEEHSAEPRAKVLLEQIREWCGATTQEAKRNLRKRHAISITQEQRQHEDAFRAAVGRHVPDAVAQKRGRPRAFAGMTAHAPVVEVGVSEAARSDGRLRRLRR